MNILPESLSFEVSGLGSSGSFFLCDGQGSVIYQETSLDLPAEELRDYLGGLIGRIESGSLGSGEAIRDTDGARRAVYYTRLSNGWYSLVTVPYSDILASSGA